MAAGSRSLRGSFSAESWVPVPLYCFLIAHRDGLVLFDTGIDPAIATDKTYIRQAIGRFLLRRIFRFTSPNRSHRSRVGEGRHRHQQHPDRSDSYLDFRTMWRMGRIPQAELLVATGNGDPVAHPEREWILREHFETPSGKWRQSPSSQPTIRCSKALNGIDDVAGDGTMILLPTPGHTAGSMSMLIRQPGWDPILLVGILTYETALLERDLVPGTGESETLRTSFAKVGG